MRGGHQPRPEQVHRRDATIGEPLQDVSLEELHSEAEQRELARDREAESRHAAAQVEVLLEIGGRDTEACLREALALLRARRARQDDRGADQARAENQHGEQPIAQCHAAMPSTVWLPIVLRREVHPSPVRGQGNATNTAAPAPLPRVPCGDRPSSVYTIGNSLGPDKALAARARAAT